MAELDVVLEKIANVNENVNRLHKRMDIKDEKNGLQDSRLTAIETNCKNKTGDYSERFTRLNRYIIGGFILMIVSGLIMNLWGF